MDFHVDYYFERNGKIYVNITRKGRNYERPCRIGFDNVPYFKFLGRLWYSLDHKIQPSFAT